MDGMSETKLAIPPEFNTASKEDRIEFVQDLWDRIAEDEGQVSVPDKHKQVLDKRLDTYRAHPSTGRPWNEVRDEILTKLRDD
jgi:putative addiction module component (TIGR02574 family)